MPAVTTHYCIHIQRGTLTLTTDTGMSSFIPPMERMRLSNTVTSEDSVFNRAKQGKVFETNNVLNPHNDSSGRNVSACYYIEEDGNGNDKNLRSTAKVPKVDAPNGAPIDVAVPNTSHCRRPYCMACAGDNIGLRVGDPPELIALVDHFRKHNEDLAMYKTGGYKIDGFGFEQITKVVVVNYDNFTTRGTSFDEYPNATDIQAKIEQYKSNSKDFLNSSMGHALRTLLRSSTTPGEEPTIYISGLAGDYCVLDTCINIRAQFPQVKIKLILDLTRFAALPLEIIKAKNIPEIPKRQFTTKNTTYQFLNDPYDIVDTYTKKNGVEFAAVDANSLNRLQLEGIQKPNDGLEHWFEKANTKHTEVNDGKPITITQLEALKPQDILIIIDMQKDFYALPRTEGPDKDIFDIDKKRDGSIGAFSVHSGDLMLNTYKELLRIDKGLTANVHNVLLTIDYHPPNHCSFWKTEEGGRGKNPPCGSKAQNFASDFPPHCVFNTGKEKANDGAELSPTLVFLLKQMRAEKHIFWKAFFKDMDSFGGCSYEKNYARERVVTEAWNKNNPTRTTT